jgi:hypothetical protein
MVSVQAEMKNTPKSHDLGPGLEGRIAAFGVLSCGGGSFGA